MEKSLEELFPDMSTEDHIRMGKDMWAGSMRIIGSDEYVFRPTIPLPHERTTATGAQKLEGAMEMCKVAYPPALHKCFDEAIVNVTDHIERQSRGFKKSNKAMLAAAVTRVDVWFTADGRIAIRNDGLGIRTDKRKDNGLYNIEFIFGQLFKGSNLHKDPDSVSGGTNGIGIKLANLLSTEFTVETMCGGTHYFQRWRDQMRVKEDAVCTNERDRRSDERDRRSDFTEITFIPTYTTTFKYADIATAYDTLRDIFLTRTIMASIYANWLVAQRGAPAVTFTFNGAAMPYVTFAAMIGAMFPGVKTIAANIKATNAATNTAFPWEVIVAVSQRKGRSKVSAVTNVNGVAVSGGKHITHVLDQIKKGAKAELTKMLDETNIKFQATYVTNNIMLFINAMIPMVQWPGQRKDVSTFSSKDVTVSALPATVIGAIVDALRVQMLDSIYKKVPQAAEEERGERVKVEKYVAAKKCSTEPMKCSLLLPEGDSARTMVNRGLTYVDKKTGRSLGYDYYGTLTLRGVIMNVRRAITIIPTSDGRIVKLSDQLKKNIFFNNFLEVTGLKLAYTYDGANAQKELASLRYGQIIVCVDQDHDGMGFIFSLIISMFDVLWPALLHRGFVKRFVTPVRRAFPKRGGKVIEFYSDFEYEKWMSSIGAAVDNYTVTYIKGLGTHERDEVHHMFSRFHENLYTYYPDDTTRGKYADLFGESSEPRKIILRRPPTQPTEEIALAQKETRRICATDHATFATEPYKRDNLRRKLWSYIDGMNESGRKILNGSIKKFAQSNAKCKVDQLASSISETQEYHHGAASLEESIFGKALIFPGGTQLPQLINCGEFGSRARGGADHASGRYAMTKLNRRLVDAIYPKDDRPVLDYMFEDGERVEPRYFVPIVPMAILESIHMPADGWKIKVWARDIFHVLQIVRYLIRRRDTSNIPLPALRPCIAGWKGELRTIRGQLYSVGNYTYNPKTRTLHITELPLRCWYEDYAEGIEKRKSRFKIGVSHDGKDLFVDMIKSIDYAGSCEAFITIDIIIAAPNGGYDPLSIIEGYADGQWADCFENYFELTEVMDNHLNMLGPADEVCEFASYEDVMRRWFDVRKSFYAVRIERMLAVLDVRIKFVENQIKYVAEYESLAIRGADDDEAIKTLEDRGFVRFHRATVETPKFLKKDEFIAAAYGPKASYDYLLDMTDRDKLSKGVAARKKEYDGYVEERRALIEESGAQIDATSNATSSFIGHRVWLRELDELEAIVREGMRTSWKFGDADKFEY